MTPKQMHAEVTRLRKLMHRGSKEIHRLVDLWTATQVRIEFLERKLKEAK